MAAPCVFSLCLFAFLAVLLSARHGAAAELETHCSKADEFPLDFDLFMELLSNHTTISRELKRAPIFGEMNSDSPAYEIAGRGFHFTDSYMSKDIKRALCLNNEVTLYASMYLIKAHSSGTLLEISAGTGARLPVFGIYFSAAANEIMFTYRHLGAPHTVSVDQRLHPGRWRHYSFVLSGHLLQFYYDCQLVFSDIVALPDFCVDEESFVVSFADDSEGSDVAHGNGIHAFFQNVGFYVGRGGISKQCPKLGEECPTCGQYLKLLENTYVLQAENDRLRMENQRLEREIEKLREAVPPPITQGNAPTSCITGNDDDIIGDGEFIVIDTGICYCRDGVLACNGDMICLDNSTRPSPMGLHLPTCNPECSREDNLECRQGQCVCEDGFALVNGACENQMCRDVNGGQDLALGENSFLPDDRAGDADDRCHVFTCEKIDGVVGPVVTSEAYICDDLRTAVATNGCSVDHMTDLQMNVSICCSLCTPCRFQECPDNSVCMAVNFAAKCVCNSFFEMDASGECVDINECEREENVCGSFAVCVNEDRGYDCICEPGYEMSLLKECVDINECTQSPAPCPDESHCSNTEGSYSCQCISGYIPTSDNQCTPVCQEPCQNGGTCVAPETCACLHGYTGLLCVSDVDECATPDNMCTHPFSECVNTIGGHFCRCRAGYQGNGTFCEDIDECESDIHECIRRGAESCINTEGSYVCSCDMVDCTGYCRRRGTEYANRESFTDTTNECNNCTCVSGEIFCHKRNCDGDCSERIIEKCCAKCATRDCYLELEDRDEIVKLRRDSFWFDPKDPCIQWRCDSRLNLTRQNLSRECPELQCEESFRVSHPGRCCKNCLLPPCDGDKEGVTLPLNNGCKQCTCEKNSWSCSEVVSCPETDCTHEEIVFYSDHCCPVCESDVVGATCQTLTRN